MDDMALMRLRDCAISTRLGMADQGFPETLAHVAAMGYVTFCDPGYKVTPKGFDFLREPEIVERLRKL